MAATFEGLMGEVEPELAFKLADLGVAPLKVSDPFPTPS
jgi:hypothetical protein